MSLYYLVFSLIAPLLSAVAGLSESSSSKTDTLNILRNKKFVQSSRNARKPIAVSVRR